MKKIFAIFAAVLFAGSMIAADALFTETFCARRIDSKTGEPGSTYIQKTDKGYWPYASQWFDGYTVEGGTVDGNQYDNDYDAVKSYTVSIRGKKLNGADTNSVGLFFGANKAAADNYVTFEGALPEIPAGGAFLHFEICSSETDGGDLSTMVVEVNGTAVNFPVTTLGAKCVTSVVTISLPAGQMESLKFAFDNVPAQKFINKFWIDAEGSGVEDIVLTEKAQKVMVDGNVYIVRDNKLFNLQGAQVR